LDRDWWRIGIINDILHKTLDIVVVVVVERGIGGGVEMQKTIT